MTPAEEVQKVAGWLRAAVGDALSPSLSEMAADMLSTLLAERGEALATAHADSPQLLASIKWEKEAKDRAKAAEAQRDKLREALAPFGDIDGEGDEDFPDGTVSVVSFGRSKVFTLTLGHFRRARAALADSP